MRHLIGKTRRRRALGAGAGVAPVGRGQADAVRRILRGGVVQAKLTVNAPGDAHEQEADRVAERVISTPAPETGQAPGGAVQRLCNECEQELAPPTVDGEKARRQPLEEEQEEEIQTKAKAAQGPAGAMPVSPALAGRIDGLHGGGRPMPSAARAFFEPRFGADFSDVRLHHDAPAAETARALRARAYTLGRDVVFGPGEYAPDSPEGRRLLAHELTHVLQQRGHRARPGQGAPRLQRWELGEEPVPAGWQLVPEEHRARVDAAEAIVERVLESPRCRNFFRDNCGAGGDEDVLQNAFDNARVYHIPMDDNTVGEREGNDIAYNLRAFRLDRYFIASTLLHEMFHTCDPARDAEREIRAENALETCRLYTPFILRLSAGSGAVGDRITVRGMSLGGRQGPADRVLIGGVEAPVHSWGFVGGGSSSVEIEVEVPAGAISGPVVVINNNVRSNAVPFTVT